MVKESSIFQWRDEYSLGIHKLDIDHQQIIKLLNDLLQICSADTKTIRYSFNLMAMSIIEYYTNHIAYEESLMLEKNYPKYQEHIEHHRKIVSAIRKKLNEIVFDDKQKLEHIVIYFHECFIAHLIVADKELGKYLNEL
jgi:hemerythrin-like metal-binding protein